MTWLTIAYASLAAGFFSWGMLTLFLRPPAGRPLPWWPLRVLALAFGTLICPFIVLFVFLALLPLAIPSLLYPYRRRLRILLSCGYYPLYGWYMIVLLGQHPITGVGLAVAGFLLLGCHPPPPSRLFQEWIDFRGRLPDGKLPPPWVERRRQAHSTT
jgi:hypothetical protein